jgi:uncharacterized protein (TIGR03085 family)
MDAVTRQRSTLCDLLESLTDEQWAAETLCEGWDAADLAAHLLVREREPWASAGLLVPPLAWLHESRRAARVKTGRDELQAQLREGPPLYMTVGIVGRIQVAEDYIHTEDVRRGGAHAMGSGPRLVPDDGTGDPEREEILWEAIGRFALQTLGGVDADGAITLTDGMASRAYVLGGRLARRARTADPTRTVTVSGPVGDLLLFTTGRAAVSLDVTGPEDLRAALKESGRTV